MHSSSAKSPPVSATGLEVRPFRALTYRRRDPEHLARVSSPAYDLVTPAGRERLAAADPHNIVRLILPDVTPGPATSGAEAMNRSADQAARTLREWQAADVFTRDAEPALWLYEMRPADGTTATVGWLGAVALPPPGSRAVLPHEDTYPPAVEGRRALLAATSTDLEPIMLAHDPDPAVAELTAAAHRGEPAIVVDDADGVRHRLWRVGERAVVEEVTAALRRTGAVIADGHHRFAAAQAHHRARPAADDGGAVLALLTPMGPGGLRVQAMHRVVPGLGLDEARTAAMRGFRVRDLPATDGDPVRLTDSIRRWQADPGQSGLLLTDGRRLVQVTDPSPDLLATVPTEAPAAWRRLDAVLAHHGLLQHLWQRRDDPASVLIAHDVPQALRQAADRRGVAVLLRPPTTADVGAVARAGARMPRKSTLFVPKPRTGLVLRPHGN